MKKLLIIVIALSFSCNKKEQTPIPVSKLAPLIIEYTVQYSAPIYCEFFFSPHISPNEKYTTSTSTSLSYSINKPSYQGNSNITIWSWSYNADGSYAQTSGTGGTCHMKVTFNNIVLKDTIYNRLYNTSTNVYLPFIP